MRYFTFLLIYLLFPISGFCQTTWYVDINNTSHPWLGTKDDPFYLIQGDASFPGGIWSASDGDTVLVAPGTYNENLDFLGKRITVRSDWDFDKSTHDIRPDLTVVDGNKNGSVVVFNSAEDQNSIIDGFMLTNGTGTLVRSDLCGGGIFCDVDASPIIRNNIISGISAYRGKGIYSDAAAPVISNNTISGNGTEGDLGYGGGILYNLQSSVQMAVIKNNTLNDNYATFGAGICFLCAEDTSARIVNNLLYNNRANGIIWPAYTACGGGIYLLNYSTNLKVINNTLDQNTSEYDGDGIGIGYDYTGPPTEPVFIENTILWSNSPDQIFVFDDPDNAEPIVTYCNVEGGWPGEGNIDADPLFVSGPEGDHYLSQIAAGQGVDSPCIDVGNKPCMNLAMHTCWTRTDEVADSGMVDMGFHYGPFTPPYLTFDTFHLPEVGGTVNFELIAGKD